MTRHRRLLLLAAALLVGLLLALLSGVNAVARIDVGDQSWVAKLYSAGAVLLVLSFGWLLDHAPG